MTHYDPEMTLHGPKMSLNDPLITIYLMVLNKFSIYRDAKAFARHVALSHPLGNDVKALQSVICDKCNPKFVNAYMLIKHHCMLLDVYLTYKH